MARRIAAVLITLGCLQASSAAYALGLGELTLESFLNEPFKAKVDLLNTGMLGEHQIRIRLATSEDFDRLGVERAYFLTSIKFEVEVSDDGHGKIVLTTHEPVLEPFLDFIIEARWPSGRLLREYTILVDPPVFDTDQTVTVSASEAVSRVEGEPPAKKKSQAEATSGTEVEISNSNLAPGDMPSRNFGSEASPLPEAGNRYMIRRDDTLWAIALKAKPQGTSVHQAMLDIQRMNPRAFIDDNINRIKAGYIIYLPDAGDISSDNHAEALAEVRQQNQDWRDGVSRDRGRASLRISTDVEAGDGDSAEGTSSSSAASLESLETLERSERDRAEVEERLSAMAQQVDTLQRIVSLKDDQIAALQSALADASATSATEGDPATEVSPAPLEYLEGDDGVDAGAAAAETTPEIAPEVTPVAPPKPAQPPAPPKDEGGIFGTLLYIVGFLIAAGVGVFIFLRRRADDDEEEETSASDDVFADIQLQDTGLEVDEEPAVEDEPIIEEESVVAPVVPVREGYGERKHDQYAADMDAGDALAEADIYIAYGRFPQAVVLLQTAIASEPDNASYKLKLMEVSVETGDQAAAMKQYADIKSLGDADSLAQAEQIAQGMEGGVSSPAASIGDAERAAIDNPLDLPEGDDDVGFDGDFGDLEIESLGSDTLEDDLDLSTDFTADAGDDLASGEDEDIMFATDADAVSTKLDLARAYLDMGDQDGARAICEEVVAEGSDEQKVEAQALLERLD